MSRPKFYDKPKRAEILTPHAQHRKMLLREQRGVRREAMEVYQSLPVHIRNAMASGKYEE